MEIYMDILNINLTQITKEFVKKFAPKLLEGEMSQ
jgi:hypothetical protein